MSWNFYNSSGELQINDGGVQASAAVFTGNVDLGSNLLVGNAGSTGIAISADGEVTMSAQPSVLAYTTAQKSNVTGNGTVYTMVFDVEAYDQGSDWDGTSTFTAPIGGKYLVIVTIEIKGPTTNWTNAKVKLVASNRTQTRLWYDYGEADEGAHTEVFKVDMDEDDTFTVTF